MTYDTKNRILHTGVYEKVKLSPREHELLMCLSDGNLVTYKEIYKHLNISQNGLTSLKMNFLNKVQYYLHIKTIHGVGLILKDEIYFE